MSKKVVWPEPVLAKKTLKKGQYNSYKEYIAKANARFEEQQKATEYLQKAFKPMITLLEMRLRKGEALYIMRPLTYLTSKSVGGRFENVKETLLPGTRLLLKSLDPNLQEFVFEDGLGEEVSISFADKNKLMTQTDIFETVQKYFENVGE